MIQKPGKTVLVGASSRWTLLCRSFTTSETSGERGVVCRLRINNPSALQVANNMRIAGDKGPHVEVEVEDLRLGFIERPRIVRSLISYHPGFRFKLGRSVRPLLSRWEPTRTSSR